MKKIPTSTRGSTHPPMHGTSNLDLHKSLIIHIHTFVSHPSIYQCRSHSIVHRIQIQPSTGIDGERLDHRDSIATFTHFASIPIHPIQYKIQSYKTLTSEYKYAYVRYVRVQGTGTEDETPTPSLLLLPRLVYSSIVLSFSVYINR